jgi:hypothetical protein
LSSAGGKNPELVDTTGDPVADLLLRGEATTLYEAEELYLDRHLAEVVALVESDLSDQKLRRHAALDAAAWHGLLATLESLPVFGGALLAEGPIRLRS